MKKIISITAAVICSFLLQNSVIAQEAPKNPAEKDSKIVKEELVCKETSKPNFIKCKPPVKMPHKIAKAIEFFKFADELQLTDEQIIKLRAYYKKHCSEKAPKKEAKPAPTIMDFYKMSDEELVKYADEVSMKTKEEIMLKLQKIIDIRKILTKEQLELIKKETEKKAEIAKKKPEDKRAKNNHNKSGFFSSFNKYNPYNFPRFAFPPKAMPQPLMPPMCHPQPSMVPYQPMSQQPGMMSNHNMPPMFCPQMGMSYQPMGPMPHQPGMMPYHNMPPMGCPQMGMMPQPPMRPMPKLDKQGKNKQPNQKFAQKNHFPMMNPMGFYPCYMPQPNMTGCCHCQKRPSMIGFKNDLKDKRPPFDFLMKLFSCKKEKDSDIITKDKK